MNIIIRKELQKDYNQVYEVVKSAFKNSAHSDGKEQDLVVRLRKSNSFIPELSLVAEYDNKIVGQILFTKISISNNIGLALAPVSVLPEYQKQGIGNKLIEEGHKIAKELGYDLIIVLGHKDYYPKFGYEIAIKYDIKSPFDVPNENFMVKFLSDEGLKVKGNVEYSKEFFE